VIDEAPPPDLTEEDRRPKNLEAEMAFIGGLLADNRINDDVGHWLRPEHFFDPVHGRIYDVAHSLIEKGALADEVTLKKKFEKDDGLKEIGGIPYLAQLSVVGCERVSATAYAKEIEESWKARSLVDIGEEICRSARDPESDAKATHEEAENLLAGLAAGNHVGSSRVLTLAEAAREAFDEMMQAKKGEYLTPTGFTDLDAKIGGLGRGELVILAGRPGMGKTLVGGAMCAKAGKRGVHNVFVAIEMKASRIATRVMGAEAGVSYSKMRRGEVDALEHVQVEDALDRVSQWPVSILDLPGATVPMIHGYLRRMKRTIERGGGSLEFVVVDYLQKLRAHTKRGGKVEEIGDISNALKEMARDLDICVVCPCQIGRDVESSNRKDSRPTLADLKWSGEIEQDADVVIGLYRDAYYAELELKGSKAQGDEAALLMSRAMSKELEFILLKNREGARGTTSLFCDVETGLIDNLSRRSDAA
jgi:replicative DNA helicase